MAKKTTLQELSSNLTEKERKEMLEKIYNSQRSEEQEYIVPVELEEDERRRIIHSEIRELTWWKRFILWLKGLLSGKEKERLFLSMKISELKKSIRRINPGITGFETRDLSVKFAHHIYDIYCTSFPLINFYYNFTGKPDFKDKLIIRLIDENYPQAKKHVKDFFSVDEMEEIYATSGREKLEKLLSKRVDDYLKAIPLKIFNKIEAEIKPIFSLKNIVLFHYREIFNFFSYLLPPETLDKKYPFFKSAPALIIIDHLERLYYALFFALSNLDSGFVISDDLLWCSVLLQNNINIDTHIEENNNLYPRLEQEKSLLQNHFLTLISEVTKFNTMVPLLDLIKYFRKDPYYRLKFYLPSLPIKTIYFKASKSKLEKQLNENILLIKERVINRKIEELFGDNEITPLRYYTEEREEIFTRLGLSYFSKIKSLTLLYNYIKKVYRAVVQDILQVVNDYFFARNKRNQHKLLNLASTLEELEDKIIHFDKALSPDEEDGKALMRLRYNIATDLTHQKIYRNLISEKDKEANGLVDKGIECLSGINEIFNEILHNPIESVKFSLKTLQSFKTKNYTLEQLILTVMNSVSEFLTVLHQVVEMEKGK
jgi:hypothetical protein